MIQISQDFNEISGRWELSHQSASFQENAAQLAEKKLSEFVEQTKKDLDLLTSSHEKEIAVMAAKIKAAELAESEARKKLESAASELEKAKSTAEQKGWDDAWKEAQVQVNFLNAQGYKDGWDDALTETGVAQDSELFQRHDPGVPPPSLRQGSAEESLARPPTPRSSADLPASTPQAPADQNEASLVVATGQVDSARPEESEHVGS